MSPEKILSYIENPSLLDESSIVDLTLLADEYPYFQVAQLLRVKNLYQLSPQSIKPVLNYTAAYVTDRKTLYYLLHPIQGLTKPETIKPPEKQIKDTIRENISDTLQNQKELADTLEGEEIEFTTSFDLRKEYGEGVELDDFVVRINNPDGEVFELIEDTKDSPELKPENIEGPLIKEDSGQTEKTGYHDDILTLINKGVSADSLDKPDNETDSEKSKQFELIDNFLKASPKIVPHKDENIPVEDISEDSVKESDHLITDTLANIYLRQGNYAKAIFAYEKLSLKYPEKSTYFAAQIADIKKLIEKTK